MEKNILDILKEKGPGFSVPKGYFDNIENTIASKIVTEKLPAKDGFTTPQDYFTSVEDSFFEKVTNESIPKGYFDTLEDRVFEKIKKEETKVISFNTRIKKVLLPLAVAASLLLIIMLTYNTGTKTTTPEIASTEVDDLIEDDYIDLNSYEIAEVFNDVSLTENETEEELDALDYMNGTEIESLIIEN